MDSSRGKTTIIFSFCVGLLMAACSDRPSNVLPEDKMVDLLADMEIAEAYTTSGQYYSSTDKLDLGKSVLKAHGVSEESLDTTLAWYGRNMDDYSELFEKVDKEIMRRQKIYTEIPGQKPKEYDNIWLYGSHQTISPLSGRDNLSFSFPAPKLEKGDLLKMTFFLPNQSTMKGTLGVEYSDGSGEAYVTNHSTKKNVELSLQTDTSKTVAKIFGTLHFGEIKNTTVYLDSIKISAEPFDSLSYSGSRRPQKRFTVS